MRLLHSTLGLLLCTLPARANVEKVVFRGPLTSTSQNYEPGALHLARLTPSAPHIRHQFLSITSPKPDSWELSETWIALAGLQPGQRYEVRVCWSATVSHGDEGDVDQPGAPVLSTMG
jgi:hypothetical protein